MAADLHHCHGAGSHFSAAGPTVGSCGHCELARPLPATPHLQPRGDQPRTPHSRGTYTCRVAGRQTNTECLTHLGALLHRNSEIYNHEALRKQHLAGVQIGTTSDSAIVGHMYTRMGDGDELWNSLDGIFACVILDERTGEFCAARDAMGVCSFYWGKGRDGSTWFASELKALQDNCETFECFPPVRKAVMHSHISCATGRGSLQHSRVLLTHVRSPWCRATASAAEQGSWRDGSGPAGWTSLLFLARHWIYSASGCAWLDARAERMPRSYCKRCTIPCGRRPLSTEADMQETLIAAVVKRLMSDAPLGVLLSGGLDSSLVASIAVRYLALPLSAALQCRCAASPCTCPLCSESLRMCSH